MLRRRHCSDHLRDLREMFDLMSSHQLRWTQPSLSWWSLAVNFLDSSSCPRGFTSTPKRSVLLETWSLLRASKNSEDCKESWPTSSALTPISQGAVNPSLN